MLHAEIAAAFVSATCPYHTYEHVLTTGPYVARDRRAYVTFAPTCTCTRAKLSFFTSLRHIESRDTYMEH
jgi:hypothetical protein